MGTFYSSSDASLYPVPDTSVAVPQYEIDFTAQTADTFVGTGAWTTTDGLEIEILSLSGDNTELSVGAAGLGSNGTSGNWEAVINLTDQVNALIDLADGGLWAFLIEFDDDNTSGDAVGIFIGTSVGQTGQLDYPQGAGCQRQNTSNNLKYFQGNGGAFINDELAPHAANDVRAIGLLLARYSGSMWWGTAADGQAYPGALTSGPHYNDVGLSTGMSYTDGGDVWCRIRGMEDVNMTRLTIWAIDANLVAGV